MKTAELTGALLDYWVARAEGFEHVRLKMVPALGEVCAQTVEHDDWYGDNLAHTRRYSNNWAEGGRLIDKYEIDTEKMYTKWLACLINKNGATIVAEGDTPLQAICRAVVRAAFGDEVGEVAV